MSSYRVLLFAAFILAASTAAHAQPSGSYLDCQSCISNPGQACQNTSFQVGSCITPTSMLAAKRAVRVASCQAGTNSYCANVFGSYDSKTCSTFKSISSIKCGGCNMYGSQFFKLVCNNIVGGTPVGSGNYTATWVPCSDPSCNTCSAPTISNSATLSLDLCVPWYHTRINNVQVFGRLMNIAPCTAVTVETFDTTKSPAGGDVCSSGTLLFREEIGQDYCTDLGRFECNGAPKLPASTGPSVLISDYATHGQCQGTVSYAAVPSGGCRYRGEQISEKVTCMGLNAQCADILVLHKGQFVSRYSPALGFCQHFPGTVGGYVSVMPGGAQHPPGTFMMKYDCDSTCTTCSGNVQVFSFETTAPFDTLYPGFSLFSMGIKQCTVVKREVFTTSSQCSPDANGTIYSVQFIAEGDCSFGHMASCGNYDAAMQSATVGECLMNTATSPAPMVQSGTCTNSAPANPMFAGQPANPWLRATCINSPDNICAMTTSWDNASSAPPTWMGYGCNQCYVDRRMPGFYSLQPLWIACDQTAQTMTITPCSDDKCSNCNKGGATVFSLFQPLPQPASWGVNVSDSTVLMLSGVVRCAVAKIEMWSAAGTDNTTPLDVACNNADMARLAYSALLNQDSCNVVCSNPPFANGTQIEQKFDIVGRFCFSRHGAGEHCEIKRHPSGTCAPLDMEHSSSAAWSVYATCGIRAKCARVRFYNMSASGQNDPNCQGFGADQTSFGITAVCGQCSLNPHWGWTYWHCDFASNNVTVFRNCSANCPRFPGDGPLPIATCRLPPLTIGTLGCTPLGHGGFAARNFGIQACDAVRAVYYDNTQCNTAPKMDILVPEGASDDGFGTITCVPPNSPLSLPGGSVTYLPCSRSDNAPNASFGISQAMCQSNLRRIGTSSMISCHTELDRCVTMTMFRSPSCLHNYHSADNVPCNTCFVVDTQQTGGGPTPPSYARVTCDASGNSVKLETGCDKGCSQCTDTANSNGGQMQLEQCAQFNPKSTAGAADLWIQFLGVRRCATAQYLEWQTNTNCQGTPDVITYVQQGVCAKGVGQITCSAQPVLPPKPKGPAVQITSCSSVGCSGICTVHPIASGACAPLATPIGGNGNSAVLTCTGGVGTCAQMIVFRDRQWQGKFSQVCGSCTAFSGGQLGSGQHYMSLTCYENGTIVRNYGCTDAQCTQCSGTSMATTLPEYQMVTLGDSGYQLLNLGTLPCNTLRRTVYDDAECKGNVVIDGDVPEDFCGNGATFSCGNYTGVSVVRTNCSDPDQPPVNMWSGKCNSEPRFGPSISSRYTCAIGRAVCAVFAAPSGDSMSNKKNTCKKELTYSAKCGSCMTLNTGVVRLQCNWDDGTITLTPCTDLSCTSCSGGLSVTYAEGMCSTNALQNGTFWGYTSCSVVQQEFFFNTTSSSSSSSSTDPPTCAASTLVSQITAQQGSCNGLARTQCGSFLTDIAPGVIDIGGSPQLQIWQCGDMHCSDKCAPMLTLPASSGTCVDQASFKWPGHFSARQPAYTVASHYSCPISSTCVHFLLFNRTAAGYVPGTCRRTPVYDTPIEFDSACNTCHYTPWAGIIRVDCDFITQNVYIRHGCDASCSNCSHSMATMQQRSEDRCVQTGGSYNMDIVNSGVYACSVVQAQGFSDTGCKTLNHTVAFPTSRCWLGSIATCRNKPATTTTTPSPPVVTPAPAGGGTPAPASPVPALTSAPADSSATAAPSIALTAPFIGGTAAAAFNSTAVKITLLSYVQSKGVALASGDLSVSLSSDSKNVVIVLTGPNAAQAADLIKSMPTSVQKEIGVTSSFAPVSDNGNGGGDGGSATGAIVGGIIGGLAFIGIVFVAYRIHKNSKTAGEGYVPDPMNSQYQAFEISGKTMEDKDKSAPLFDPEHEAIV